ncbi:hypothetical protein DUI87_26857 [Hirundo rustica rustica]|uniref:Uncharacterized protein n=1 Tax=Hirundo rustica rustica TaxID=333673 RepID=A0A3M0J602_HIRRU|nr:hypothetical protein DUI87_26857 [Hirundo rustica rustica]
MRWGDSRSWGTAVDGYKLFRRHRKGGRGGGVSLYVGEAFDTMGIETNDNEVECLWVRIQGKASRADILLGVFYRPPNQEEEVENLFYKQQENISGPKALVLLVDTGKAVDVVYLDFSKAFDTISHSTLLEKLAARGLDRSTLCWVWNWLHGWAQRVMVNSAASSWQPTEHEPAVCPGGQESQWHLAWVRIGVASRSREVVLALHSALLNTKRNATHTPDRLHAQGLSQKAGFKPDISNLKVKCSQNSGGRDPELVPAHTLLQEWYHLIFYSSGSPGQARTAVQVMHLTTAGMPGQDHLEQLNFKNFVAGYKTVEEGEKIVSIDVLTLMEVINISESDKSRNKNVQSEEMSFEQMYLGR